MISFSSFENYYLWLPLIGFIIGFFGTITGGGGGIFFIPILIILFGVPAHTAVPTSLAAAIPICVAGSVAHYRKKNLDFKTGLVFMGAGILGALSGASITNLVTSVQLKKGFGIYSVLLAGHMLINLLKEGKSNGNANGESIQVHNKFLKSSFFGFLAGIITGTFGTSGIAPVLAGMLALKMPLRLVLGTSLMVVLGNTISALGAHFLVGEIDVTLLLFLTSGTVVGAIIGPCFFAGLNIEKAETPVRMWFAILMIAFGVLMIVL